MAPEALKVLAGLLTLAFLWLFFVEYRKYRIELLRFKLFVIRDDLFKKAQNGQFAFDDRAYDMTRSTLNGMLRFAHDFSLTRLLLLGMGHRYGIGASVVRDYRKEFSDSIAEAPFEQKKIILETLGKAHAALAVHVAHTSFLLSWWIVPFIWVLRAVKKTGEIRRRIISSKVVRDKWSVFDAEANSIGDNRPACC